MHTLRDTDPASHAASRVTMSRRGLGEGAAVCQAGAVPRHCLHFRDPEMRASKLMQEKLIQGKKREWRLPPAGGVLCPVGSASQGVGGCAAAGQEGLVLGGGVGLRRASVCRVLKRVCNEVTR